MISAFTISVPMVTATAVPENAPVMLRRVARRTALRGVSTRVETTVAMALGASVQPLTNSADKMRKMTTTSSGESKGIRRLEIFDDNHFKNIGYVLTFV